MDREPAHAGEQDLRETAHESPDNMNRHDGPSFYRPLLLAVAAYFALSAATLPFAGKLWIGELPVLALIQIPKLAAPQAIRTKLTRIYAQAEPPEQRTFSPYYLRARTPALAIGYALPLGTLLLIAIAHTRGSRQVLAASAVLCAVAAIDFCATIAFAGPHGGNGFSMY